MAVQVRSLGAGQVRLSGVNCVGTELAGVTLTTTEAVELVQELVRTGYARLAVHAGPAA